MGLECSHVAGAAGQVAADAGEDLNGGFAVDGAEPAEGLRVTPQE